MPENSDHPQPRGKTREQILKDLETAGLLRHIGGQTGAPRENARRPAGVVIPFRKPAPKPSVAKRRGNRWLAIAAYVLAAAIVAWLYLAN